MLPILKLFIQLCFFRISPEALPYSKVLLCILVVGDVLSTFFFRTQPIPVLQLWLAVIVSTVLSFVFVYYVLYLKNIPVRLIKIMTALFGIAVIFSGLFLLLQLVQNKFMMGLFGLSLLLWDLMLKAHIFRFGLGITFVSGVFVALLYQVSIELPIVFLQILHH
ncbi:MAG TPA: hypothetical protein VJ205_00830 [Gammaproteobacteria bacterium]|nr:hypothetical protein [Gammaproteobacteria bacterium]